MLPSKGKKLDSEQLKFFNEEGFLKLNSVFTTTEVNRLKNELEIIWINSVKNGFAQVSNKKPLASLFPPMRNCHEESQSLRNFIFNTPIFSIMRDIFSKEALLAGSTCFYKVPGADELPLHQDNYDIGAFPGTTCAFWISLDEATTQNGCLKIVPRTHKQGLLRPNIPGHKSVYGQTVTIPKGFSSIALETSPGDVVLFSGDTLHGSFANQSKNKTRNSLVMHFVPSDIEKIFVQHRSLLNSKGEVEQRKLNKSHSIKRLFREKG